MKTTTGYSATQIALHWIIAALVGVQVLFHNSMVRVFVARSRDQAPVEADMVWANVHVAIGLTVFVLIIWRMALRFTKGAPPAPDGEGPLLRLGAQTTHVLLYALIVLLPVSGAANWFLGIAAAARVHSLAEKLLLLLLLVHIAAAFAHHFWFKTDVLKRMLGVRP